MKTSSQDPQIWSMKILYKNPDQKPKMPTC